MTPDSAPPGPRIAGFRVTPTRRLLFFLGIDTALVALAFAIALLLRLEGGVPASMIPGAIVIATASAVVTVSAFYLAGIYRVSWTFFSLRDTLRVAMCVAAATFFVGTGAILYGAYFSLPTPRSIPLIQAPFVFLLITGFRLSPRLVRISYHGEEARGVPTLLVGAGKVGEHVARSIFETSARNDYRPVGLLDDDRLKRGTTIHGIPILGSIAELGHFVARYHVGAVIVTLEQPSADLMRQVLETAKSAGVREIRVMPPLGNLDGSTPVSFMRTREIGLEDLLGREAIHVDLDDVRTFLKGKRVLVTGGAGTIGSELCRQIAGFEPEVLAILDVDESRLNDIALEIRETRPQVPVRELLVDVRDSRRVNAAFADIHPNVVLHAAAYKHVPMMEQWPVDGLAVNVLGTSTVLEAAAANGASSFVLISTDKAVNPCNVMGASKRMAELLVMNGPASNQRGMVCSAVRFGNVLGSRGSVIPIFERQLRNGGPITVTHPDVERYFMTTSEAVTLVLQSSAMRESGVFFLDIGRPVKIAEMAREYIRLHGLRPDEDVKIVFTGLRPGERLTEQMHYDAETFRPTRHPQIRISPMTKDHLPPAFIPQVQKVVQAGDHSAARSLVTQIFPMVASKFPPSKATEMPEKTTVVT